MANFLEQGAHWLQKPQSMLSGATLGALRSLGISDPNSKFMPGATNAWSGLLEGNRHQILPEDFYKETTGHAKPSLLEKLFVELPMNIGYDPLMLAGPLGKAGEGLKVLEEGAKGAEALSTIGKVARGAKLGEDVTNVPKILQAGEEGSKVARGATRAVGSLYAGNLATKGQNLGNAAQAGAFGAVAGPAIGKVLGPAAEYVGPKIAPEGSRLAQYLEGRALGQKLGVDPSGAERYGTFLKDATSGGDPTRELADLYGGNTPDPVKAAATQRLITAKTPTDAASAALQGGTNELNKGAFDFPTTVKTGPGTYGEIPMGPSINPQGGPGLADTQPWKPSTRPDPTGQALFTQDTPALFDQGSIGPGRMADVSKGAQGRLEFPGTSPRTGFNEPQFGMQEPLPQQQANAGPVGALNSENSGPPGQANAPHPQLQMLEQMFSEPSAPNQHQLFDPQGMDPGRMAQDPNKVLGAPVSRDYQMPSSAPPENPAIPPFLQNRNMPSGPFQETPGPPMQQNLPFAAQERMKQYAGRQAAPLGSQAANWQPRLADAASGGDIVQAIQEGMRRGMPYDEVMRVILSHQFPGRF